jgi:hypothetical protein
MYVFTWKLTIYCVFTCGTNVTGWRSKSLFIAKSYACAGCSIVVCRLYIHCIYHRPHNSLFSSEIPDRASSFSNRPLGLQEALLSLCQTVFCNISKTKYPEILNTNSFERQVYPSPLSSYHMKTGSRYTERVSSFLTGLVGKAVARRQPEKESYSLECDHNFS